MPKSKPVLVAKSPSALARTLGLSRAESRQWQVQYALLKQLRQIVRDDSLTHAQLAQRIGSSPTTVNAILSGNLDNVSSGLLRRLINSASHTP